MPLLFPDDLDDDFVEGTYAAEWARLGSEIEELIREARHEFLLGLVKAANTALGGFLRLLR